MDIGYQIKSKPKEGIMNGEKHDTVPQFQIG
jgi:hypothetical protein